MSYSDPRVLISFIDIVYAAVIALGFTNFPTHPLTQPIDAYLVALTVLIIAHDWYHYHDNIGQIKEDISSFLLQIFTLFVLQRMFAYASPSSIGSWLLAVFAYVLANLVWNRRMGFKLHAYRAAALAILVCASWATYASRDSQLAWHDPAWPILIGGTVIAAAIWQTFRVWEKRTLDTIDSVIRELPLSSASEIVIMQKRIYPERMQDSAEEIKALIESSDLSRGIYKRGQLIGYGIVEGRERAESTIYLYDVAILPDYQRKGLGTRIAEEIFRAVHSRDLRIEMHCRKTSYPLFGNPDKMKKMGYRIVHDQLVPDFYLREYGVNEDAHLLKMVPVERQTQGRPSPSEP